MWDAPDYAGALAKLGFDIERQEDLSQHVAPTYAWVRRELERRRPEFEGRIGKDLVDRTSAALQFWVDSAEAGRIGWGWFVRSEEHTSELQSLMRLSYAVFCLKKKKQQT